MAAVLLAVMVGSTQPPGVLAASSGPAGSAPAGEIHIERNASALATRPLASRADLARATVTLDPDEHAAEPTLTFDDRALDSLAEPAPIPATLAPAAVAAAPERTTSAPRVVRAAARPARLWAQLRDGLTVTGVATWYRATRGYAGIPHVAMPGARYLPRGRTAPRVRVCAGGRCVIARVVDACACRAGTRQARLVDLSATMLGRLGLDPRRGVYRVRVTLVAP